MTDVSITSLFSFENICVPWEKTKYASLTLIEQPYPWRRSDFIDFLTLVKIISITRRHKF